MSEATERKSDQKWEVPNPGLPKVERSEALPKAPGEQPTGDEANKEGGR
jgi:hypothetical protein